MAFAQPWTLYVEYLKYIYLFPAASHCLSEQYT